MRMSLGSIIIIALFLIAIVYLITTNHGCFALILILVLSDIKILYTRDK